LRYKWNLLATDANLQLMSQVMGISEITANVMANRGIRTKNTATNFLRNNQSNPKILDSSAPMKHAQKMFDRIILAISQKERIIIYGDYDADGVMSTAILYKSLAACNANVEFYIPNREEEGYGLNISAVRAIKQAEYDLIITCDNGIAALEEVQEANNLDIDIIIIDHHEPGFVETENERCDVIPKALAVVNPKQADCAYPFKNLCAAGLSFRLMEAFYEYTGNSETFSQLYEELITLAAIATVCDIVDLHGDNRNLVKKGLTIINANKNINNGLFKLIELKGYLNKPIDTFTIGFVIGPCINATGRLESAETAVKLLISDNETEQQQLAQELSDLNDRRKELTRTCSDRILEQAAESPNNVLVLVDEQTHESIAGIVAGRVKEKLHRPTILLTSSADEKILKGSARSIESYNIFEALYANRDLFERFGGHAMAAGMSIKRENVDILRERLNAACTLTAEDLQGVFHIDREIAPAEVTVKLAAELAWLAPFGKANHEPLFVTYNLKISALRNIEAKNTLIFTFENGLKGIAFGLNQEFAEELANRDYSAVTLDIVHIVETNTYNGKTTAQMRIKDFNIREI